MGKSPKETRTDTRRAGMAVCLLAVVCGLSGAAQAHKVNLFAYVEGEEVIVEGYFSASAKAMNCAVDVLDGTGRKLLEGKTDAKGVYAFKIAELSPISGDLKIVLHAGQGHKNDFTIPAADLPASVRAEAPARGTEMQSPAGQVRSEKGEAEKRAFSTNPVPVVVDNAGLKKVLDDALDAKIRPLVKMLGKQQKMLLEQKEKGPSMIEIFGGIGWIMGIFGTAAYFAGRNRAEKR